MQTLLAGTLPSSPCTSCARHWGGGHETVGYQVLQVLEAPGHPPKLWVPHRQGRVALSRGRGKPRHLAAPAPPLKRGCALGRAVNPVRIFTT